MARKPLLTPNAFSRFLPILVWLPAYDPGWLRDDVVAGLTLWAILVPEGIAYSVMAGGPLQAGLYTLLGSLAGLCLFGHHAPGGVGPDLWLSIMMAPVAAPFLVSGPRELAQLLVLLVLVVGIIFLLCGLARLGFVTVFISHSVMTGFIFRLAINIAVNQAPKIFGLHRGHGETIHRLWIFSGI